MISDPRRIEEGFDLVELARRLANVIRAGVVAEVDLGRYRVRVRYDVDEAGAPVLTAPIPWLVQRAGPDRAWWAPEVGEQVVLLAPSGELTQAYALPGLYSAAHPAPSADPDKCVDRHSDGATFEYDRAAHRYTIRLPAGSRVMVQAGSIVLMGATETLTIP